MHVEIGKPVWYFDVLVEVLLLESNFVLFLGVFFFFFAWQDFINELSGDELLSDSFPYKEIENGILWEVEGKVRKLCLSDKIYLYLLMRISAF